ncbi:nitrogenase component 1 [Candidatus Viridilinea mediisalina]|uniref:Chlorophyllide reductase subunit Z n=1 Tax=Candidatus Viridilinea mediisalina TaxID=2024553 RepID=A0A2A6RDT3_9CHLR|nr:nitrogenase component 1 [Candidatus Viridilinea mediisalina]PDV99953.1 chlorophyllide reductase subunit Z [Candidatus Viridilinea mediisalina]
MTIQLIRDISDSSAYWGAAWVFGCFPDLHVVCDAPIGCYNLLGMAVTDYTDALPHMANLTPTSIREEDVINGTAQALVRTINDLRTLGALEGKRLVVVSTAESEMISADHGRLVKQLDPEANFFWSQSLDQDEWMGRERALAFAWEHYGQPYVQPNTPPRSPRLVNIIGPSLGCFNAPADLHEVRRLIEGVGGEINLVYPYESSLAATPQLADAAVSVVLYQEFGADLARTIGRPQLFAPFGVFGTTSFLRELGSLLGTPPAQVEAFIAHEKRTTLQPVWDLWRGPQSDWFATVDCAIVAGRSYVEGLQQFLGTELGMKVAWSSGRPRRDDEPDNIEIRRRLHAKAPAFVFGSINEKIYLAESGARASHYIPATFPGPVVRRTTGTPFMGYAGAANIMQEIVNRFYDMVFNFLPVEQVRPPAGPPGHGGPPPPPVATPAPSAETMPWSEAATTRLNLAIEQVPFLARISASRSLRQAAEQLARNRKLEAVSLEVVEEAISQGS